MLSVEATTVAEELDENVNQLEGVVERNEDEPEAGELAEAVQEARLLVHRIYSIVSG